jgi:hypothetical protein
MKLSSAKHYLSWTYAMNEIAGANLLTPHIDPTYQRPAKVNPCKAGVARIELEQWESWVEKDFQMQHAIRINVKPRHHHLINGKNSALEMWEALEQHFKGKGLSQLNKCIDDYMLLNLEDPANLKEYTAEFKENIRKLEVMEKTDIKHWHCYRFIEGVSKTYELWGHNWRTKLRQEEELPQDRKTITLQSLIDDLDDEARTQSQSTGRVAYYGNKSQGSGKGNKDKTKGRDSNRKCKHCKEENIRHKEEDCFILPANKEKKLAFEKKFGKKYVAPKDTEKDKDKKSNKPKSKSGKRKMIVLPMLLERTAPAKPN